jgi:hypothetical protein
MNVNAKLNALFRRQAGVALDHPGLNFERATHGVDHAAKLDNRAVAGALDDAPAMHSEDRIDHVAT